MLVDESCMSVRRFVLFFQKVVHKKLFVNQRSSLLASFITNLNHQNTNWDLKGEKNTLPV